MRTKKGNVYTNVRPITPDDVKKTMVYTNQLNIDRVEWKKLATLISKKEVMFPVFYQEKGYVINSIVGYGIVDASVCEEMMWGTPFAAVLNTTTAQPVYETCKSGLHIFYTAANGDVKWLAKEVILNYVNSGLNVTTKVLGFTNGQEFDCRMDNLTLKAESIRGDVLVTTVLPMSTFKKFLIIDELEENEKIESLRENCQNAKQKMIRLVGGEGILNAFNNWHAMYVHAGESRESPYNSREVGAHVVRLVRRELDAMEGIDVPVEREPPPPEVECEEPMVITSKKQLHRVDGARNGGTGVKGVHFYGDNFTAQYGMGKGEVFLGVHSTLIDAIDARSDYEEQLFGKKNAGILTQRTELLRVIDIVWSWGDSSVKDLIRCGVCLERIRLIPWGKKETWDEHGGSVSDSVYDRMRDVWNADPTVMKSDKDILTCRYSCLNKRIHDVFYFGLTSSHVSSWFAAEAVVHERIRCEILEREQQTQPQPQQLRQEWMDDVFDDGDDLEFSDVLNNLDDAFAKEMDEKFWVS